MIKPKVIGAGLGRTGTLSLKTALERLLGSPCYHMVEVFERPEHIGAWHAAAAGDVAECVSVIGGYAAAVDWPSAAFYSELADAFPEALVILSYRDSDAWWSSASETIFKGISAGSRPGMEEWHAMIEKLLATRFTSELSCKESCIRAFEAHNEQVKQTIPAQRLLLWQASDGWEPICKALNLPVPDELQSSVPW